MSEIISFIEDIKNAELDDKPEVETDIRERLGNTALTYNDLEEVVSYIIYNLSMLQKGSEKRADLKHENLVNVLDKYQVITKEQLNAILKLDKQTDESIENFLEGDHNNGK